MKCLIFLFLLFLIPLASSVEFIVFPDIQGYTNDHMEEMNETLEWVINNSQNKTILFVGDLVQENFVENQWDNLDSILNQLETNNVSFLLTFGDHDIVNESDWVGIESCLQRQNLTKFLLFENESLGVISLPPFATNEQINYSQEILNNYSNYSFILLTHRYTEVYGVTDLDNLTERLINNSNLFLTISGHQTGKNLSVFNNSPSVLAGHSLNYDGQDGMLTLLEVKRDYINYSVYSPLSNITRDRREAFLVNGSWSVVSNFNLPEEAPRTIEEEPLLVISSGGGGGSSSSPRVKIVEKAKVQEEITFNLSVELFPINVHSFWEKVEARLKLLFTNGKHLFV